MQASIPAVEEGTRRWSALATAQTPAAPALRDEAHGVPQAAQAAWRQGLRALSEGGGAE